MSEKDELQQAIERLRGHESQVFPKAYTDDVLLICDALNRQEAQLAAADALAEVVSNTTQRGSTIAVLEDYSDTRKDSGSALLTRLQALERFYQAAAAVKSFNAGSQSMPTKSAYFVETERRQEQRLMAEYNAALDAVQAMDEKEGK